jgi:hypothetical protein
MKLKKYPICEDIKSYTIQKQIGNIHFDINIDGFQDQSLIFFLKNEI